MYIPDHFKVKNDTDILEFIRNHGFGQLVSSVQGELFVSHLPMMLEADNRSIICHMARQNPQWRDIEGQQVLLTFHGPHGYVSPSWYATSGVPTWNYQVAHVYGRASVFEETEAIARHVESLTAHYEASLPTPWIPDYSDKMLNALVGVQITVTRLEGKFKLSQNKSTRDRNNVAHQLIEQGEDKLAAAMRVS